MPRSQVDDKEFQRVFKSLRKWADFGIMDDIDKASRNMLKDYKQGIERGVDGAGNRLKDVKQVTMDSPIRYSTDRSIRGEVRPSKKPLIARGRAVDSLQRRRVSKSRVEIKPVTDHGKIVFGENVSPRQNRNQNSTKAVRDPLIVSKRQDDIIEKEILKGIDNAIRR